MIVPVILYGSSVLRKHSPEVTEYDDIQKICDTLFDTLKQAEGIGLAAPQVNLSKRVFVIDTSPLIEQDKTIEKFEGLFINPEILERSNKQIVYREGCLSLPDIYEEVERPERIHVLYKNSLFETIEEEMTGVKARIFQHEFDHLNGVLFIDKLGAVRRSLLTGKLNRIKKASRY